MSDEGLRRVWRVFMGLNGDHRDARAVYDAVGASLMASPRQIVLDWVVGSHFIALTDCPMAYLKLEASRLGVRGVERMLHSEPEFVDPYTADIAALERGEAAPSALDWPPVE